MTEPRPCGTVDEKEGHGVEYSDEIDYSIAKRLFSLIIYELKVRCGLQGLIPVPEHMHSLGCSLILGLFEDSRELFDESSVCFRLSLESSPE